MTYPYLHSPSNSISFEDGYLLSPWGRGNLWYKGIAETDIWECMAALEDIAVIDPARKYLSGHSMGGYGAWSIASKSADTWAALGIMAGALWYYPVLLDENIGQALKYVPTYFICGTNDDLLEINRAAYQLLKDAGNWRLQFNTFSGGHEYVEQNVTNMYLWMRQYTKSDIPSDINEPDRASHPDLLIRCSPNPVTTTSTIVYSGPDNSIVDISIYNLSGSFVANVARGTRIRGGQSINYDASDLKPGIYFIRIKSLDKVADAKMVVIR
jgi:pimeloyl-ACP methyl ester carboxylesterase